MEDLFNFIGIVYDLVSTIFGIGQSVAERLDPDYNPLWD